MEAFLHYCTALKILGAYWRAQEKKKKKTKTSKNKNITLQIKVVKDIQKID